MKNTPSRITFPSAGECIYCGAKERLTMEHIVPFCLGGRFELPHASCNKCQEITKKIEQKVCQGALHLPRTVTGVQTRNRRGRPNSVIIKLEQSDGRKTSMRVSIDEAPIINIVPVFRQINSGKDREQILSRCTLTELNHTENNNRFEALFKKTGAAHITASSGSTQIESYTRVLWKIAVGFFWLTAKESLWNSGRARTVLGKNEPIFTVLGNPLKPDEAGDYLFADIFSKKRPQSSSRFASARVFSSSKDNHTFIYCEIALPGVLAFPLNICRIKNLNGPICPELFEL